MVKMSDGGYSGSADRFGYSWNTFRELRPEHEEQFKRWTSLLDPAEDWRCVNFIDVGCGMGRNAYWAMTYGAASGLAIDVDERSLAAARANLKASPTVRVANQSIYDLDADGTFDIAFSIGVIHHLTDPDLAIAKMRQAVKPGGRVLIWVYGMENMEFFVKVLNPLRAALFSRMPLGLLRMLAYLPAASLWLLLRLGLNQLGYFRLLRGFSFRHLHAIVFDQMLPRIANYWRRDEVLALMQRAGLVDIDIAWCNEMSWTAIGTREPDDDDNALSEFGE
jgi:SAM-dependent methyltransferase